MQIHLDEKPAESVECDALVAFTFEGKPNDRFKDSLSEVYASGEVTGKPLEMTLVHRPAGFKAKRVCCWQALGRRTNSLRPSCAACRGGGAASEIEVGASTSRSLLDGAFAGAEHVAAAVEGAMLGDYEPDRYKSDKKGRKIVEQFTVAVRQRAALDGALARGRAICRSAELDARAGQRAGQPADAHCARRARPADGGRAGPGVRSAGSGPHEAARHGLAARRGHGQRRAAGADRAALPAGEGREQRHGASRPGRQGRHVRHRRHLHQARRRHGEDEVRHGGRRGHDRGHARASRS